MQFFANAACRASLSVCLLAAASSSAFAQSDVVNERSPFDGIAGIGITFGGDTLVSGRYSNGDSWKISSGGGAAFYGGLQYRLSDQFALQGTVGYHTDRVSAENGSIRFSRMPVEVVGLYNVNPQFRLGGGVQHVSSPKVSSSGAASGIEVRFDPSTALVLDSEYLFSSSMGMKVRYVGHKFTVKNTSLSVNGDHIGLMLNFYF